MSGFDQTIDLLTGARILKCERRGVCLDLWTDKGRVIVGAHRAFADLVCMGCGEERLVELVETAGKHEAVCAVCGRNWKVAL